MYIYFFLLLTKFLKMSLLSRIDRIKLAEAIKEVREGNPSDPTYNIETDSEKY